MVFLLLSGISVLFFVRFLGPYQNINHWYELFSDLIINNRSTMVALKYVEQNGYTYGVSMLGYVLGIIPVLQGLVNL